MDEERAPRAAAVATGLTGRSALPARLPPPTPEPKGAKIPSVLLEHPTANLFDADRPSEAPLHPADQITSALLGASTQAQVARPGGGQLRIDRKGIQQLRKASGDKVPEPTA